MPRRLRPSRSCSPCGRNMPARDDGFFRGALTKMASRTRLFTWLGAFSALSPAFVGCGSSAPARPAVLDPSNPDGPESPQRMSIEQPAELKAMEGDANAGMAAPDARPTQMHSHDPDRDQPGTGTSPAGMNGSAAPPRTASSAAATIYTCTMHPEVTSDKPGRCPKCGMKLVPRAAGIAPNPPVHVHDTTGGTPPASGAVAK